MTVRTRFAPSPTGYLHVGGIRTALFAWLLARQHGGAFILRIEDTDQARLVKGSQSDIVKSLHALGLDYDEGPDKPGAFGPYLQSERVKTGIYRTYAEQLIESGRAYVDPYSSEEVQAFREQAQKNKRPFLYRNHRPETLQTDWDGAKPLRFKSDPKHYTRQDAVMGELNTPPEAIDDFILVKSDGFPTYNFAHIVDDAEMQITHIIRGQEFLASMPNYINLYEALTITPPVIATVPHIMNEAGNKKLSKRDGAASILDYISNGYLPDALLNFIASMGWNDGTEQEKFSRKELIEKFSLERIQKSGARFDERRLLWLNGAFIRDLSLEDLYNQVQDAVWWPANIPPGLGTKEYKMQVLGLVQERLKFFAELPSLTKLFFEDLPVNPELISDNKQLKKLQVQEQVLLLRAARKALESSEWNAENLQTTLNILLEKTGQKPGILFSLIRIATTQSPSSPGLAETLELLGKERSLRRLDTQLQAL